MWFLKCWYLKSAAMHIIMCILKQQLEWNSGVHHHREGNVKKLRSTEHLIHRSFTTISKESRLGSVNNIPWIYPIILLLINHYFLKVTLATSHYSLKSPPLHSLHWIQLRFSTHLQRASLFWSLILQMWPPYYFSPLPRALLLTTCNVVR